MSDPTTGAADPAEPPESDARDHDPAVDAAEPGPFDGGPDDLAPPPGVDAGDGADGGGTSTWRDALTSTEPDTPLSEVESPWNPDEGGASRVYRGFQKATGTDGVPAWVDLILGVAEVLSQIEAGDDGIDASGARDAVEGVTDMGGEAPDPDL